ncbi:unnamed protein product [Dicrocoelium dendriticum]|nr:unnamed protein product [Dicrocoelium dendriticum]
MEHVLDLKLPWRTLQPQLVTMCKETHMVEYATTFQKINVRNALTSAPASVTEELYKQRDNLESIFRAMDKDNSGLVSLDEFKATCLRLPAPTHLDEVSITDLARSIDFNKDGQIDFNEFLEAFRLVETELGNV